MKIRIAGIAALGVLLAQASAPASAETVSRSDPQPHCSQAPALDLKRVTFSYSETRLRAILRMGDLRKKKTQVVVRFTERSTSEAPVTVVLKSKFADGRLRTTGTWSNPEAGQYGRIRTGLRANWDWTSSRVRFDLTTHLPTRSVVAEAYSVPKGADHGPPCGDYIVVRGLQNR